MGTRAEGTSGIVVEWYLGPCGCIPSTSRIASCMEGFSAKCESSVPSVDPLLAECIAAGDLLL
eukprot:1407138-Pyramimonas_sp.AAC.1